MLDHSSSFIPTNDMKDPKPGVFAERCDPSKHHQLGIGVLLNAHNVSEVTRVMLSRAMHRAILEIFDLGQEACNTPNLPAC